MALRYFVGDPRLVFCVKFLRFFVSDEGRERKNSSSSMASLADRILSRAVEGEGRELQAVQRERDDSTT